MNHWNRIAVETCFCNCSDSCSSSIKADHIACVTHSSYEWEWDQTINGTTQLPAIILLQSEQDDFILHIQQPLCNTGKYYCIIIFLVMSWVVNVQSRTQTFQSQTFSHVKSSVYLLIFGSE